MTAVHARKTPLTQITDAIAAERRELAQLLASLPAASWDAPTLCAGWRVRDVVAHMTMPFRYSARKFALEMVKSGGNFAKMADRCARRDAARPAAVLQAELRDNERFPWQPPGGGFEGALVHDVIHGLDITVPLGVGRQVPPDRLRMALAVITKPKTLRHFGTELSGFELRADDMDWSIGAGSSLTGNAQDLALVLCGRALPAGRLCGEPSARFTSG
jgi:uncharacterized protein (TIGR03083 family)